MSVFNRAVTYVKRNVVQSVILFMTIFLLGIAVAGVVSIDRAIAQTEENLWRQLPTIVTITEDFVENELYWQEHGIWPAPPITQELIEMLGTLPYVQTAHRSVQGTLHSRNLELAIVADRDIISLRDFGVTHIEQFPITGVSQPLFSELNNEVIQIIQGNTFNETHFINSSLVALVSTEFANENSLIIGSTIELESVFLPYALATESENFADENIVASFNQELEIIGIFDSLVDEDAIGIDLTNRIYLPDIVLETMMNFQREAMIAYFDLEPDELGLFLNVENFLELTNPHYLPIFREAALEILPEFLTVRDLSDSFDDVAIAMNNIRFASEMILLLIISAGVFILSLVIILLVRTRKHEIGIYLALGEKKQKILSQLLIEIMFLTSVAVMFSILGSFLLANRLSNWLLINEINTVEISEQSSRMFNGLQLGPNDFVINGAIYSGGPQELDLFRPAITPEALLALFDTSLNSHEIFLFSVIVILTVLSATTVPIIYIVSLAPKKILL